MRANKYKKRAWRVSGAGGCKSRTFWRSKFKGTFIFNLILREGVKTFYTDGSIQSSVPSPSPGGRADGQRTVACTIIIQRAPAPCVSAAENWGEQGGPSHECASHKAKFKGLGVIRDLEERWPKHLLCSLGDAALPWTRSAWRSSSASSRRSTTMASSTQSPRPWLRRSVARSRSPPRVIEARWETNLKSPLEKNSNARDNISPIFLDGEARWRARASQYPAAEARAPTPLTRSHRETPHASVFCATHSR